MSLQLSEKFSLPLKAALWTFAILAIKGAGKTYNAAKMAEQMIKNNIPIVVLDPMGIWWGLRVGVDGKEGLPVVIFGGDHADLPIPTKLTKTKVTVIDEEKLRQTVLAILQSGLSVVLDTHTLSMNQQTRTVGIFADELYKQNGPFGVRHVFIEEADIYCPQHSSGEKAFSQGAIDNLVRRGGNFNLGCTMITQRAAVLNKDVLSQATCLMAMRIMFVRDKDAIRDWVRSAVKDERELHKLAKWYDTLKTLKNGEEWIYSPEHEIFEKVQFGERETLHASREYFLQETWEQKNITLRDVTSFVKAYKTRVEPKPKIAPDTQKLSDKQTEPIIAPFQPNEQAQLYTPNLAPASSSLNESKPSQDGQTIDILRSTPVIQTQRSIINVVIPTDARHPLTALGKLGVIMKDDPTHSNDWTPTRARKRFGDRQWATDGLEEAFNEMISLGVLTIQSNRAYTCRTKRIEITEKVVNVIAP